MKKVLLMTAAIAAMVFTSCSKDENGGAGKDATHVSIKVSGVIQSRAVEAPGSTAIGTIRLNDGHIFVINPMGGVTYHEALNVIQATTGSGQVLGQAVAADSRIYIIGNIPSSDLATISAKTTITDLQAAASLMTTQVDYRDAALANSNGIPASIVPGANNTATVDVSIKPLISRLELTQIEGGTNITAFNVKGVYVDNYHPSFTYAGGFAGTMFSQDQSATFTGIGDAGTWAATGTPLVAAPASGNVWAHNVASGALPRFIIALDGVKYKVGSDPEVDLSGTTYYLTVTGYNNLGSTVFERGKIYRIGGTNGITFGEDDLGLTPNPVDVTLTLEVTIEEWVLVTPDAIL